MAEVAQRFVDSHPDAFDGDAVSYLRTVYCDPNLDVGVRIDAARAAAKFERPALGAVMVKDVSTPQSPEAAKTRIMELIAKGLGGVEIDG